METCPACGSPRIYPSRARSIVERMWRAFTRKRPYRCHACNWRRWIDVPPPPRLADSDPEELRSRRSTEPIRKADLDGLDPPASA
jgi:hypothetical protein